MTRISCPSCGESGRSVGEVTLRSLVRPAVLDGLGELGLFAFCAEAVCELVYFTADGRSVAKDALSVRVGVKEQESPRPLCYCFGYSAEDIEDEVRREGSSGIPATITERCRGGEDRCPETNPRGACCLGDVRRVAKAAGALVEASEPACCGGSADDD